MAGTKLIAGRSIKKYAVVGFLEEDNVEVIPSTWILNASETKWPKTSPLILSKYIKECKPIDKEWKALKIKIYGFSNTFKGARYKANLAQDTSNLESDSESEGSLRSKQRKRKRPARYQTTDTSASENESISKKAKRSASKLSEDLSFTTENDSTVNSSYSKKGRRGRPSHCQSTDTSVSEKTPNFLKKNHDTENSKSVSTFNARFLLKQRRRKKPARYQSTDTSASENEFNVMKYNCDVPKLRKKSDSTSNDSLTLKQRSRKKPARYRTSDESTSENESHFEKKNSVSPKIINGDSPPKCNSSFNKDSLRKAIKEIKPSSPSKEKVLHQNESTKEKQMSAVSNKGASPSKYKSTFNKDSLRKEIEQIKPSSPSKEKVLHQNEYTKEKQMCSELNKGTSSSKSNSSFHNGLHKKENETKKPLSPSKEKVLHRKVYEQKKPSSPAKENVLHRNESAKGKQISPESNKGNSVSVTSPNPKNKLTQGESVNVVSVTSRMLKNTSTEGDSVKMLSQILQHIQEIHGELRELNSKYEKLYEHLNRLSKSSNDLNLVNICLPIDIELPVTSVDMLLKLNNKLKADKDFSTALVHYLHAYGNGKEESSFLLSLAKKILAPEVAISFSTSGRKGKKSFFVFPEVLNVIITATTLKFNSCDHEDVLLIFDKHLAESKDWLGKK